MIWFSLLLGFWTSQPAFPGARAEAGLGRAPRLCRASLCCPLPAGKAEAEAPPSRPSRPGTRAATPSSLQRGEAEASDACQPLTRGVKRLGLGAVGFEKAARPTRGIQLVKRRPPLPKAGAPRPPSWLQALPLHTTLCEGKGHQTATGFWHCFLLGNGSPLPATWQEKRWAAGPRTFRWEQVEAWDRWPRRQGRWAVQPRLHPLSPLTCCWTFQGVSLSSRGICVRWKHPERQRDRKQIPG